MRSTLYTLQIPCLTFFETKKCIKHSCLVCTPCWPKTSQPPKSSGDAMFDSVLTCPQANLTRRQMPALLFLTFKPAAVSFSFFCCTVITEKVRHSYPSRSTQLDSGTMRINESCKCARFLSKVHTSCSYLPTSILDFVIVVLSW